MLFWTEISWLACLTWLLWLPNKTGLLQWRWQVDRFGNAVCLHRWMLCHSQALEGEGTESLNSAVFDTVSKGLTTCRIWNQLLDWISSCLYTWNGLTQVDPDLFKYVNKRGLSGEVLRVVTGRAPLVLSFFKRGSCAYEARAFWNIGTFITVFTRTSTCILPLRTSSIYSAFLRHIFKHLS
jgi:hypothetical protein